MKKLLFSALAFVLAIASYPQSTPVYSDNFESYSYGDNVSFENPTWWTTWSGTPGPPEDGVIVTGVASSGTNAVAIDYVPGYTDLVLKLGDRTTGKYSLNWKMFIQNSYGGYFNVQHFEAVGVEYAYEVWFDENGAAELRVGGNTINFNYPKNTWFEVENVIDLDQNFINFYIYGQLVYNWPFSYQASSTTGTCQLGGVDFYATTGDGSPPFYLIDDVNLMKFENFNYYFEDFESYSNLDYIALENPVWWKTWSNLPGSNEDGRILSGIAYSGNNKLAVDFVPEIKDVLLKLGERQTGKWRLSWYMYLQSAYGGHYNIQHYQTPGREFGYETWFDANGAGRIRTGGAFYDFVYPKDTWFLVENQIDLDNNWIVLYINGVKVHEWPFSYVPSGITGFCQLGGVDFYGDTYDGSPAQFFIDDLRFAPLNMAVIPISDWAVYLAAGLMLFFAFLVTRRKG